MFASRSTVALLPSESQAIRHPQSFTNFQIPITLLPPSYRLGARIFLFYLCPKPDSVSMQPVCTGVIQRAGGASHRDLWRYVRVAR